MSRTAELLRHAAAAMEDGRDPFSDAFLCDNNVTLDECYAMSDALAVGARLVAWGLENPAAAQGAINGAGLVSAYQAISGKTRHHSA